MNRQLVYGFSAAVAVLALGCGGGGASGGGGTRPPVADNPTCVAVQPESIAVPLQRVAAHSRGAYVPASSMPNDSSTEIRVHTNHLIQVTGSVADVINGYTPAMIQGAYGVPPTGGSGAIAVVTAFHYPTALNDFNVFATQFGLPTEPSAVATSSSNQVFRVVYAAGSQPPEDGGWAQEAALDTQWAHAMAPFAKIYLVEAKSSLLSDMIAAVNVAKGLPGVKQVSMSFGASEYGCAFVKYNSAFNRSGVTFFAASGDAAEDRMFPGISMNVVTVGGTSLAASAGGTWLGESVWQDAGCGPSRVEPRPVYQDFLYPEIGLYKGGCDIAAVADPATGVAVYDSFESGGFSGWMVFGGTSAACPIVAGCVNNAGVTFTNSKALNAKLYTGIGGGSLHDIVTGASGAYSANTGWDSPTGVGTPNNLAVLLGS